MIYGLIVPPYAATVPVHGPPPPPYWRCCDVVGHPGETVCWACGDPTTPAPPPLHTSTGSVLRSEFPDELPPVERLIERTP